MRQEALTFKYQLTFHTKGFQMKSIKYAAMAILLVNVMTLQAMNNKNNNKQRLAFAGMSSEMQGQIANQLTNQLEEALTQEAGSLFDKDMEKFIASLDSTDQDATIEFPPAYCYTIGQTAYLVNQAWVNGVKVSSLPFGGGTHTSDTGSYYQDSPDSVQRDFLDAKEINLHDQLHERKDPLSVSYHMPHMSGKLADVIFARAVFAVSSSSNNHSPDDIRTKFIADYISYFNQCKREATEPIPNQLNALKEITFDCTYKNITALVAEKLPGAQESITLAMPNYILKKACARYLYSKNETLVATLNSNYSKKHPVKKFNPNDF